MMLKIGLSCVLLITITNSAFALRCDRYQIDPSGFGSLANAESWYPSSLFLDDDIFEAKSGSKQMIAQVGTPSSSGELYLMDYSLLPNGKLIAAMRAKSGFQAAGQARYKCDLNAIGLRAKIG